MKIFIVTIFMSTMTFMKIQAQIVLDHDFPNQRVDMVTLEHAGPKYYQYDYAAHTGALLNLDYTVYDSQGVLVRKEKIIQSSKYTFERGYLSDGIYLIQLINANNQSVTKKLILN